MSSFRIISGSIIQTLVATNVGLDTVTGSSDTFRQGINIRSVDDLTNYVSFKFRPNTSLVRTIRGRDVDENIFDDSMTPDVFSSGTFSDSLANSTNHAFSAASFAGEGRTGQRVSHHIEIRDLGQSTYFSEDFYADWQDLEPKNIIQKHPLSQRYPDQLVTAVGKSDLDGVIEPFFLRRVIDGSIIDHPFVSRAVHGSIGGAEDAYRRVAVITDSVEIEEQTDGDPVAFLDFHETFGSGPGAINLPGAFLPEQKHIFPFADVSDREEMTKSLSVNINESTTITEVLCSGSNFKDDDDRVHELNATRGFTFHYSEFGYDSIAFGGLKK